MPQYFKQFPTTVYDGKVVRDITRSATIKGSNNASADIFYPYTIKNWLRSDNIAEFYYEDAYNDWLIYLSNDIVDPYYQWYLNNDMLNALIIEKYGSLEIAQRTIKHYQNNWDQDEKKITPSFYNNNMTNSHKKYYTPEFGVAGRIVAYKRKADDTVTNTNRILSYEIANNSTFEYSSGEIVNIRPTGTDETVATGQVVFANSSTLRIKNVSGNTGANTTDLKDIIGVDSSANCTANSSEIYLENFSNTEVIFWSEVSFYDWEVFQNEQKKELNLIGDAAAPFVVEEFKKQIVADIEDT